MLDTSSADLIADLFVPLLRKSVLYDRGVGYFSSGWFRIAAEGMAAFAGRGGLGDKSNPRLSGSFRKGFV